MIKTSPRYVKKVEKNNVSFERSLWTYILLCFCFVLLIPLDRIGELAQMVERPLCMREVPGSMPGFSIIFFSFFPSFFCLTEIPWNLFCRMFLSSHRKKGGLAQMVDRPLFFFPFPCSSKLNWSKKVNKTGQYSNYRIFATSPADSNC